MLKAKLSTLLRKPRRHEAEDSLVNDTSLLMKITCPLCGVNCVGSAAEVIVWREGHGCRPAERAKGSPDFARARRAG